MNFSQLQERLRVELQRRIARGTMTPTLLARMTGLGQSFVSNYVHGKRGISGGNADKILEALGIGVGDLLPAATEELRREQMASGREAGVRRVPLVSHATAMREATIESAMVEAMMPFPEEMFRGVEPIGGKARARWERFVAIRLSGEDVVGMTPLLLVGSVLVIDRHYNSLRTYAPAGSAGLEAGRDSGAGALTTLPIGGIAPNRKIYAVRAGGRLLLRHVEFQNELLVLRPHELDHPVEVIKAANRLAAREFLVGRVALDVGRWYGR